MFVYPNNCPYNCTRQSAIVPNKLLKYKDMKTFKEIKQEVENNPSVYHEGTLEILNSIEDKETQKNIAEFICENNWSYGNDHWSTYLVNNTEDWI